METTRPELIKGTAVSPGIARGVAHVLSDDTRDAVPHRTIGAAEVTTELARFAAAREEAAHTLTTLQRSLRERVGDREAAIFDAQILLLSDPAFVDGVSKRCAQEKINVEAAVAEVIERYARMFAEIEDVYLRERAGDLRDVGRRVLDLLLKQQPADPRDFPAGAIVVATELFPSTTARMNLQTIRGIVTERGGKTSHASILTRSLGIPGVIGVADATRRIHNGDSLIVDGIAGTVFVNPRPAVTAEYDRLEAHFRTYRSALKELVDLPAVTLDGTTVRVCANIGKVADVEAAKLFRAEGVGLYRTEFNFLIRDRYPTSDEQYELYSAAAARMHPHEVVFRVLDIGSDKNLPYLPLPTEANPALGLRGVRLLLRHRPLFESQLRAILRVSASHHTAVLVPMVGDVDDVLAVRQLLREVQATLRAAGQAFDPRLRIGAMIETPSAALLTAAIAREVDFLSVGTNDLIQHMLTVDRGSNEMTSYYEPLHPAVLRALKHVIGAAHAAGKDLSICGEMAGTPAFTELLLGLGARILSVTPGEILEIKRAIRSLRLAPAEQLARDILALDRVADVRRHLETHGTRIDHASVVA